MSDLRTIRTDVFGSLLRPASVIEARKKFDAGELDVAALPYSLPRFIFLRDGFHSGLHSHCFERGVRLVRLLKFGQRIDDVYKTRNLFGWIVSGVVNL